MEPDGPYTTTTKDGSFAFYNLPEGEYQVMLAQETLPGDARLTSASEQRLEIRTGVAPTPIVFYLEKRPVEEKPIRRVLEEKIAVR